MFVEESVSPRGFITLLNHFPAFSRKNCDVAQISLLRYCKILDFLSAMVDYPSYQQAVGNRAMRMTREIHKISKQFDEVH